VDSMQFNVSQLLKESAGTERRYTFEEQERRFEEQGGAIRGSARLMRTADGVLVVAEIETRVAVSCSRCLAQFDHPVMFKMADEYIPSVDLVSGGRLSPSADGSFSIDARHVLDLSEAVGQHATLTLPMKPLCAPDCAGLCSTCGVNLNQTECGCVDNETDSRWSELKALGLQLGSR